MKTRQTESKLFAFKLAAKKAESAKAAAQWKSRDGVATAGCTFPSERYSRPGSRDNGIYC